MMSEPTQPYWVLISVLFSSVPLTPPLAMALHQVAAELYRSGDGQGAVDHALAHGVVRNLKRDAMLGVTLGPMFEADLETERGKAQVRFLLTRQGLELTQPGEAPASTRSMMN
jgi:hypothetical protein